LAGRALLALPSIARAQAGDWPRRAVRYINPFPAGGSTDVLSRIYCARMTEITGQSFVVENRAGAGGNVGCGCHREISA
jgi:tripartite-type tricarboxylate transporter receptor subunit TctC